MRRIADSLIKQYKRLAMFLAIFVVLEGGIYAYASEEYIDGKDDVDCVVCVQFYYVDDNSEKHLLSENCGILIGNAGEGASYVITNADMVELSNEEISGICANYSAEESKITTSIEIVIGYDITIPATVTTSSKEMNIAVLQLNQAIFDRNVAIFNMDDNSVIAGQNIRVLGKSAEDNYSGNVISSNATNGVRYIQHNVSISVNNLGGALLNNSGEVIGICQYVSGSAGYFALDIKEVASILGTLGIPYTVADHTDYSVDMTALETAISVINLMDYSEYTEESVANLKNTVSACNAVMTNEQVTQEEVDVVYQQLLDAQASLLLDESMEPLTLILIILATVFLLALVGVIIFFNLQKKKKLQMEKQEEEKTKRKAPIKAEAYIPSAAKTEEDVHATATPTGQYSAEINDSYSTLEGFAPSSAEICMNAEDTTILGATQNPHLLTVKNSVKYQIERYPYVIGKSRQKADCMIDNSAISRAHASISRNGTDYYIEDLSSTNGSYLDSVKLEPGRKYMLHDGSKIKVADEEIIFHV